MREFLDALCTVAIFWALVGALLFAPVWAKWIDGETEQWERDAAERHANVYADVRCER